VWGLVTFVTNFIPNLGTKGAWNVKMWLFWLAMLTQADSFSDRCSFHVLFYMRGSRERPAVCNHCPDPFCVA
jgi:hypothetical protein